MVKLPSGVTPDKNGNLRGINDGKYRNKPGSEITWSLGDEEPKKPSKTRLNINDIKSLTAQMAAKSIEEARDEYHNIDWTLAQSRITLTEFLDLIPEQVEAVTVVGSQAVHERTKQLSIPSTSTKDADVVLTPELLKDAPHIEQVMRQAGYKPLDEFDNPISPNKYKNRPGMWGKGISEEGIPISQIDMIVPAVFAGKGRRSVKATEHHGEKTASKAEGLELATVDRDLVELEDFSTGSTRQTYVAGTASLIIAKAFKLGERVNDRNKGKVSRVSEKDAGDLWRLMACSDPKQVGDNLLDIIENRPNIAPVAQKGIDFLLMLDKENELLPLMQRNIRNIPAKEVEATYSKWMDGFVNRVH